jgi:hypothetical protein
MILPAHYFVYMLVLVMGHEHMSTGTAYRTETACVAAADEENKRTSSAVRFKCEPIIVLKE